jgi:hypothetical protein
MPLVKKCGNCKYVHFCYENDLRCHRYPPILSDMTDITGVKDYEWPRVDDNDWCGEFVELKYSTQ